MFDERIKTVFYGVATGVILYILLTDRGDPPRWERKPYVPPYYPKRIDGMKRGRR